MIRNTLSGAACPPGQAKQHREIANHAPNRVHRFVFMIFPTFWGIAPEPTLVRLADRGQ